MNNDTPDERMQRRLFLQRTALVAGSLLVASQAHGLETTLPDSSAEGPVDDSEEIAFASATALAAMIASNQISSTEAVEMLLARIERYNPRLNAIVEVFGEAKAEARRADKELAKGQVRGPLHGVPITIKDVYAIAGKIRTYGFAPLGKSIQATDSLLVSRLREAGAILIGRTNVPVFANDWQTFNELYGTTNNPWDVTRTPGGSSGGCAAAVAAGLSYLSLAGDLGGSIRVPAHFCGIFGHRPSRGVVPVRDQLMAGPPPPTPEWEAFVPGPLARSAQDLRTAMNILGGFAEPESVALRWTMPAPRRKSLQEYKIGYVLDDAFCPLVPELRAVYEEALIALRAAGVRLRHGFPEGFSLQQNYLTWAYLTSSGATSGTGVDMLVRGQRPPGEETYFEAAKNAESGRFIDYKKKHYQRQLIQALWRDYFKAYDAFLMPPSFVAAFPHGSELRDTNVLQTSNGPACYGHLNVWPSVSGLSGHPSTTFPAGFTAGGLPAGFEVLGPALEDGTSIDVAEKLAAVLRQTRRPPFASAVRPAAHAR